MVDWVEWWKVAQPIAMAISPVATFTAYQQYKSFSAGRADKAADRTMTEEERQTKAMLAERADLSAVMKTVVERLETDRDRLSTQVEKQWVTIDSLRVELDQSGILARHWHGEYGSLVRLTRNLIHDLGNLRQHMLSTLQKYCPEQPAPQWDKLPDMPRVPGSVNTQGITDG